MVKGKTVRVRHMPVLAVFGGCCSWEHKITVHPNLYVYKIRHWDIPGRRLFCRIIRESESLPARVDTVSVHSRVNHWSSLYLELYCLVITDNA